MKLFSTFMIMFFCSVLWSQTGECIIQSQEPFQLWIDGELHAKEFEKEVVLKQIKWSEIKVKAVFENPAIKPFKRKKIRFQSDEEMFFDKVQLVFKFNKKNKAKLVEIKRETNRKEDNFDVVYPEGSHIRKGQ